MLHAERLSPSRSLCIAQTNTRRPVHSFFRIPFHSTTTGQRMQEINELLSRQQYVFFTRSPVERNRVCVGSGLDRSASTAFRLLQTSNLCQAERSRPFLTHMARVGKNFLPYFIILMPRKVYSMATLKMFLCTTLVSHCTGGPMCPPVVGTANSPRMRGRRKAKPCKTAIFLQ